MRPLCKPRSPFTTQCECYLSLCPLFPFSLPLESLGLDASFALEAVWASPAGRGGGAASFGCGAGRAAAGTSMIGRNASLRCPGESPFLPSGGRFPPSRFALVPLGCWGTGFGVVGRVTCGGGDGGALAFGCSTRTG